MKLFDVDLEKDVAVIAEIGVNHEGDVDVAARLVEAAAKAGAHAVKFQSYTPERFVASTDAERAARVRRFGLDEAAHRRLANVAKDSGIAFFSSAITEDWVPLIAELSPAIKIASGDLTFQPVIIAAAKTGKPVILSTGGGSVAEVDRAVGWFKEATARDDVSDQLVLLHCVSGYPTPIEQANLRSIPFLAERYRLNVGWSNHVLGPLACVAAVALGASVVEVHMTDQKSDRQFRDHSLSFEALELAELVNTLASVHSSLGSARKVPADCEVPNLSAIRKGVVAAHDLLAGTVVARDDLMFARPATEFSSNDIDQVIGCTLTRPVAKGETIARDGVREPQASQVGRG
jgi:N-acetylneuraminate synthase/N,N'-diacetyllegionaminate synthase